MAYQSSNINCKDMTTCQEGFNCDPTLIDQQNIVLKFDERELELCGFIDKTPLEVLKFFCDIILRKGSTTQLTIDYLDSYIHKANPRVQQIIKNTNDIREFLSKYTNLFTFDGDKIVISDLTVLFDGQIRWIKTLLQSEFPDINKTVTNAIQFYSDILYDKEDNFPLDKLVTHRNKAKLDVQLIAVNPVELKAFLIAYPQIFIVKDDKVSLSHSAACDRSDYSWLGKISGMKVLTPKLRLFGKAVLYYLLILFKNRAVHQLKLSKLFAFRNLAPKDVMELTNTEADLKNFFVKYSCVFQINKNNVMIKDSLLLNLKRYEFRLNVQKGSDLSKKEVIYMVQENLIKTALDVCIQTIKNKLNYKCLLQVSLEELMSEFEYLFENVDELKKFLSYHPHDFIIKDDSVLLTKRDDTNDTTDTLLNSKSIGLNTSMKQTSKSVLIEQAKDFCVNFLLQNVGVNVQFSLIHFKQCISLAPPELQKILRSEKYFKAINNRYCNALSITDDYILLKKGYDEPDIKSPKNNVNECLMFFIWVLKEKVGAAIEFPIARLKTYLDVAPSDVKIPGILQLKAFLQKHPNVFVVKNNNVILKKLNDEKYAKITKYEKLTYAESYSTSEAIAFYARVLKTFCFNLGVPVEHLFGYQSLASVEVIALAKTPCELNKFLSTHPDIFTVQGNNVCLTKNFDRHESVTELNGDQETLVTNFYSFILSRVSYNNEFPIVRLFGYQYLASLEIRDVIKTPLELKDFLKKHSDVFLVNNDVVLLKKSVSENKDFILNDKLQESDRFLEKVEITLRDLKLHSEPDNKAKSSIEPKISGTVKEEFISRKSSLIRAIRFYSNIMFQKGPNSEHLISNLLWFRSEATNEIKEIASRPDELLTFLSEFPQIFTVNSSKNTVILTDMVSFYKNERNWVKELLPKYHQSTTNHETVVSGIQFYVNHIFERGSEVVPFKSLFKYRKTAMGDVQALANSGDELKDFLSMYPEIFKISNDGVSLTAVALSHKTEPKWIEEIVGDNTFLHNSSLMRDNGNNELSKSNLNPVNPLSNQDKDLTFKDKTSMAINFLKSILETKGKNKNLTDSKIFKYLHGAPIEIKELFTTQLELKDFFTKNPDVFTVKDNFVSLACSKSDSKVKKKKKKNSEKKLESNSSPATVSENSIALNNHENCLKINSIQKSENQLTGDSEKECSQADIVSSILFYSNIIFQKGPHMDHNIGNIFSHCSKASSSVRETVKNTKELEEFLSRYPQLFSVDREKHRVAISDLLAFHNNQRSWIKDLLPKHHQSTTNHETIVSTIQFYSNILFEKYPKCELSLQTLFSHKNLAMGDLQVVRNFKEMSNFLSLFPSIFTIDKDKVILTESAISQLKQPKWIEEIVNSYESTKNTEAQVVNSTDTNVNAELVKKKKTISCKAVQFYYKFMLSNVSNKGFSLSELLVYLHEAPHDVQEVAKTVTELREFFLKYPHIFTITNNMVFLTSFKAK